jgi:hypothetical protein
VVAGREAGADGQQKQGRGKVADSGPGTEEDLARPRRTQEEARVPGGPRCLECDWRLLAWLSRGVRLCVRVTGGCPKTHHWFSVAVESCTLTCLAGRVIVTAAPADIWSRGRWIGA